MSKRNFAILILAGVVLTILVAVLVPGVIDGALAYLDFAILAWLLTTVPATLGFVFDWLVDEIDERVDIHISITPVQHRAIGFVFGILAGLIQLMIVEFLPQIPAVVDVLRSYGVETYVVPSAGWWLWGLATFYILYITQHKYHEAHPHRIQN